MKLKQLILDHGKDKINSLTKYPSILTLHKMGEKGRLTTEITTPSIINEIMYGTEKIDGTNTRIIIWNKEYLIGSREFILYYSNDLYFDPSQRIVEGLKNMNIKIPQTDKLTVIYGEFYGGKVTANSKWYGTDKHGFRIFDIAVYDNFLLFELLDKSLPEISNWREKETENGIIYGQKFLTRNEMLNEFSNFEYVPLININLDNLSYESIYNNLKFSLPETKVSLSDKALKKAEGLVLRNENRSKIVKIRFEDYERTLNLKK